MTDFDEELDKTLDDLDDIEDEEEDDDDFDDTDEGDEEDDDDEEEDESPYSDGPAEEFGEEEDTDAIEQLPDSVLNNPFAGLESDKAPRKDIEAAKDLTKKKEK